MNINFSGWTSISEDEHQFYSFRFPLTPNSFFASMLSQTGWVGGTKLTLFPGAENPGCATELVVEEEEDFKYLGVVFTSEGRRNKEIDTRISKANAFLRELYRSVVIKEIFQTPQSCQFLNRSLFRSSSMLWIWVMAEELQAAEMGFLRRGHVVTLGEKVRGCEIHKTLNIEPLLRIERSQLRWFGHVSRMSQERLVKQVLLAKSKDWWSKSCWLNPKILKQVLLAKSTGKRSTKKPSGMTTSPTLLVEQ